jgi:hypothetical protein
VAEEVKVKETKDFGEVMRTIVEAKGDLRDIYKQKPDTPQRPSRVLAPSQLSKKLLCLAFNTKEYIQEPFEKRQQFDILSRMSLTKTIIDLTRKGYRLVETERPSGRFNGMVDLVFESKGGQMLKVEVKSSKNLKQPQILQSILYHETGDRIAVASFNEILEPEDWLIEPVKTTATEVNQFLQEFPNEAAETYTPHKDLCPSCANTKCPFKRPN